MSTKPEEKLQAALTNANFGETVSAEFLRVWPAAELLLETFSKVTKLPIVAFLRHILVFESSIAFFTADTSISERKPCLSEFMECNPGMRAAHREIDTPAGILTILMGEPSIPFENVPPKPRLETASMADSQLSGAPEEFSPQDNHYDMNGGDFVLADSIAGLLRRLVFAPAFSRESIINIAHETSLSLLGMGFLSEEINDLASEVSSLVSSSDLIDHLNLACKHLRAETQLGLFLVRNFLSHNNKTRYDELTLHRLAQIDLFQLLTEMIDLYAFFAAKKGIIIESSRIEYLPKIYGSDLEIKRLFHNILNNAVKYSYHSTAHSQRTIRVSARVPYDPGFRERRLAITFTNYGLGLTREEQARAFEPGFRGQQARREVPVGSGLGLSEAFKIMKMHHGQIRLQSEERVKNDNESTYLTIVELIFPY